MGRHFGQFAPSGNIDQFAGRFTRISTVNTEFRVTRLLKDYVFSSFVENFSKNGWLKQKTIKAEFPCKIMTRKPTRPETPNC